MKIPATPMPDKDGYFGDYGGQIIPPELQAVMDKITAAYDAQAAKLAAVLHENFKTFSDQLPEAVNAAGPVA